MCEASATASRESRASEPDVDRIVAVMSGKLEEATNWEVMVGPRECSMLPKYLQEVWN